MKGHIIVVMGLPASGKTTYTRQFEAQGYIRLNRDEIGGSLDSLVHHLDTKYHNEGITQFVMDNTYATMESRKKVILWARANEFTIDCHWLDIDIGAALYNAAKRMINYYNKLLMPSEIKIIKDSKIYPPVAIYTIRKKFQVPTSQEGFHNVKRIPFERKLDTDSYVNRALILDYDGTLRTTISGEKYPKTPKDIQIFPERAAILKEYHDEGYYILGVSNQSGVAKKEITLEQAIECFEYTNELLNIPVDYAFCPHSAFPQICYCRKPIPGMGVAFIEKYKLNPARCIMIGDLKTDRTFAERCGFRFQQIEEFFKM